MTERGEHEQGGSRRVAHGPRVRALLLRPPALGLVRFPRQLGRLGAVHNRDHWRRAPHRHPATVLTSLKF